jgi:hypothetical protein
MRSRRRGGNLSSTGSSQSEEDIMGKKPAKKKLPLKKETVRKQGVLADEEVDQAAGGQNVYVTPSPCGPNK